MGSLGTRQGWAQWAQERDEALKDPYGWLSLTELKWLSEIPEPLDTFSGLWSTKDGDVLFEPQLGQPTVFLGDEEVTEAVTIPVVKGESNRQLRDEWGREVEVIYRFWGPAVRVRDPKSRRLQEFAGIERFDFDPSWVLRGRIIRYDKPREEVVGSAVPEGVQTLSVWGEAEVVLPDQSVARLGLTGSPDDASVMFFDETNDESTPGWRVAEAVVDGDSVIVDLNRSQIFPAHLSPHGTCPKPPESNRIPLRVEAGEKLFDGKETQ